MDAFRQMFGTIRVGDPIFRGQALIKRERGRGGGGAQVALGGTKYDDDVNKKLFTKEKKKSEHFVTSQGGSYLTKELHFIWF